MIKHALIVCLVVMAISQAQQVRTRPGSGHRENISITEVQRQAIQDCLLKVGVTAEQVKLLLDCFKRLRLTVEQVWIIITEISGASHDISQITRQLLLDCIMKLGISPMQAIEVLRFSSQTAGSFSTQQGTIIQRITGQSMIAGGQGGARVIVAGHDPAQSNRHEINRVIVNGQNPAGSNHGQDSSHIIVTRQGPGSSNTQDVAGIIGQNTDSSHAQSIARIIAAGGQGSPNKQGMNLVHTGNDLLGGMTIAGGVSGLNSEILRQDGSQGAHGQGSVSIFQGGIQDSTGNGRARVVTPDKLVSVIRAAEESPRKY